jgi:LPXTG-motif cell wall-anchored protein
MGKRTVRALLATALAVGAGATATATPAHADTITKKVTFNCGDVYTLKPDGTLGNRLGPPLVTYPIVIDVTFTLTGPTEVFAGSTFTATSPSSQEQIPADNDGIPINEVKNLKTTLDVTGAAGIATPTFSGGNVLNPSASVAGNQITINLPGTNTPSVHPGSGAYFFPGGSTFTRPQIDTQVTAGAAGTQIVTKVSSFETNTVVLNGAVVAAVRNCVAQGDPTVGVVNVVAPPVPGAPNAVSDAATTKVGTAVTIDVLKNDTADASETHLPIDTSSLALVTNPAHGTAQIVDGKVVYTPAAGYAGQDSFDYKLCSKLPEATTTTTTTQQPPAASEPGNAAVVVPDAVVAPSAPCDTATVNVTVEAAAVAATTTPTTKAAVAAAAQLPRTGRSTAPLAIVGATLVLAGAALGASRRQHRLAR